MPRMPCSASPSVLSFHAQSRHPGLFSRARRWLGGLLALASLAVACAGADYWNADTTFVPALEGEPGVYSDASPYCYPGGKTIVSTGYGIINGKVITPWLTRLNADGSVDPSLVAPAAWGWILAVYPDGRILYCVQPDSNGPSRLIQRMLGDGTVDSTFTPILVSYGFFTTRLLADERILLFGDFVLVGGVSRLGVARLNADGTLDTGFQSPFPTSDSSPSIQDIVPTAEGDFYMVGTLAGLPAGQSWVARLNADGSVDNAFNLGSVSISDPPRRAYPQADGSVVTVDSYGNFQRYNASGVKDTTFSVSLPDNPHVFGSANADGKIYYLANPYSAVELRRLNADFTADPTFTPISTPYASSYQVTLPSVGFDGELYLGALTAERRAAGLNLSRVSSTGTIDPNFNPRFGPHAYVGAHLRQPDGRELITGPFTYVNNTATATAYSIVRLLADGALDSSFSAPLTNGTSINRLALQPDGKILAFGWFPQPDGSYVAVRRFATDGTLDSSFVEITDSLSYPTVDATGRFYAVRGGSPGALTRHLANGQIDSTFQAPADATSIRFIVPLPDGKVLIAQLVSGTDYTLKRLLATGAEDAAFTPISLSDLVALVGFPDGSALVTTVTWLGEGRCLSMRRLPPGATSDGTLVDNFNYTSHPWTSSQVEPDIEVTIGGVLLDLLREASPSTTASVQADFSTGIGGTTYDCRSDGELMAARLGSGAIFQRYLRSDSSTPSFDPGPFVLTLSPASALLRPLKFRPHLWVQVIGLGPFNYQWLKDGNPLPGAENLSDLYLRPIEESDAGVYSVAITNAHHTVISAGITLTVDTAHASPVITSQPANQTVPENQSATFTVGATGTPAPSYQWYFNDEPIFGATSATLTIARVRPQDAGDYYATASNSIVNGAGTFKRTVITRTAALTVTTRPRSVPGDIDGDGTSDVVWRYAPNGLIASWTTSGGYRALGSEDANWKVIGSGDFDGDGMTDMLWRYVPAGLVASWTSSWGYLSLGSEDANWKIVGTGDFDGDGYFEALWRYVPTGRIASWASTAGYLNLGTEDANWKAISTGDFDGDGHSDVLWRYGPSGLIATWTTAGTYVSIGTEDANWRILGTGDYDGDGTTDVLWRYVPTGLIGSWTSSAGYRSMGTEGSGWTAVGN